MRVTLPLLLSLLTAGCATTTSTEAAGPSPFPTAAALDKIAAAPPPAKLTDDAGVRVADWTLAGPLPDTIAPLQYSDGSPWQALLEEAAASRPGLVATPASMRCVAQENGRFFLEEHAVAATRLQRFIAGRCGAVAGDVRVTWLDVALPARVTPEEVVAHFRAQLLGQLRQAFSGGPQVAGIWYGQKGARAVVMMAVATRRAILEPMALVPGADGNVTLAGEVLEPADHVEAVFNRGHFGFGRCSADTRVLLPHFRITCSVDRSDDAAWIEVAAFPAGRILGHVVADVIVFPSGAPSDAFHDGGYVTREVPAGPDARAQLFALVNEVRQGAGLPAVTLAPEESAVAEKLAPHYFAALAGQEPELVADQVVLGLRAGWQVGGDVLDGQFAAGVLVHSRDLGRLLDDVLDRPSGRAALLDRSSRLVALGPVLAPDQPVVAMVAASYALFEGANFEADAQRVLGRLTKARVDEHAAPPSTLSLVQGLAREAAGRVLRGEATPRRALQRMLDDSADRLRGVPFRGWVFEVSTLDDLRFPPELVRAALGGVAIAVSHYRPKNGPWSRLVVFILAVPPLDGPRA